MNNESPAALLPELIAKLRERYKASAIPTCRVCGGPLSVQSCGGGRPTVYGCDGQEDDPNRPGWLRYREGRRCADQHYSDSQWTDYSSGGDSDVLQLCDLIASTAPGASESRGSVPDREEWWLIHSPMYIGPTYAGTLAQALAHEGLRDGAFLQRRQVTDFKGDELERLRTAAPTPPAVAVEEGAFTARVVEWKGIRFGVPAQIAKSFMAALEGTNGEPTAEQWKQAIMRWYAKPRVGLAWDWIAADARELARSAAAKGEG